MTTQGQHQETRCLGLQQLCWSVLKTLLLASLINGVHVNGQFSQRSDFQCREEGYHADPTNCQIYYRCVAWGNNSPLTKFNFECGPGTVFSHDQGDICVHPRDSERPECNESGNDLDSNNYPENNEPPNHGRPPTSPSYERPMSPNYGQPQAPPNYERPQSPSPRPTEPPSVNEVEQPSYLPASQSPSSIGPPVSSSGNDISRPISTGQSECQQEGFFANRNDCKKFYRCVDDGRGSYLKYDFTCGDGTVWDPTIEGCNHIWAVKRDDCTSSDGGGDSENNGQGIDQSQIGGGDSSHDMTPKPSQTPQGSGYPYPTSQSPSYPDSGDTPAPQPSEYIPPCKSTEQPSATPQPMPPGFTAASSGASNNNGNPPESKPGPSSSSSCTEEGFFGEPSDCTKFYRCVQEGNSLTKYDFACGEGTAWDQSIQSCNHIYAVPSCGGKDNANGQMPGGDGMIPSESDKNAETSTQKMEGSQGGAAPSGSSESPNATPKPDGASQPTSQPSSGGESTSSSPEMSTQESSPSMPGESPEPTAPESSSVSMPGETTDSSMQGSSSSPGESSEPTKAPPASNQPSGSGGSSQCQEEGFFPDPTDCRKFYRCVSTGNNKFTKYTFDCAPGTAWDQSLLTCNYIDQVASCGSEMNEIPSGGNEQTSMKPVIESMETSMAPKEEGNEMDMSSTSNGEESSAATPSSSSPTATSESASESTDKETTQGASGSGDCSTPKPSNNGIVCDAAGFYPNPTHCDKFYRCVDNGNGFNVYHFDCPPGTIFDPSISVCNYPESVYPARNCAGGEAGAEPTKPSAETEKPATSTEAGEAPATETSATESTEGGETSEATTEMGGTTEAGATEAGATEAGATEAGATEAGEETTTGEGATTEPGATEAPGESGEMTTEMGMSTEGSESAESTTGMPEETTAGENPETPAPDADNGMAAPCTIGNLTDEQIVLVCPTGFRRHPKYCNMFYQCSNEDDMKIKILVLACPEGTIFDEEKIQCKPESESSKPCETQVASSRIYRQVEDTSAAPIRVKRNSLCPDEGHYPYKTGCSNGFYKCVKNSRNQLQGYLYKCPKDFVYWSVSRRCERANRMPVCSRNKYKSDEEILWEKRWELPIEESNRSARMIHF